MDLRLVMLGLSQVGIRRLSHGFYANFQSKSAWKENYVMQFKWLCFHLGVMLVGI